MACMAFNATTMQTSMALLVKREAGVSLVAVCGVWTNRDVTDCAGRKKGSFRSRCALITIRIWDVGLLIVAAAFRSRVVRLVRQAPTML